MGRDKESGQWHGGCAIPFTLSLSLSLYPDTSKASSKLGKRRVIKSAFQHLIIARRNLISNPFCAALFTARFPSLQMYWFFQIRSNLPSICRENAKRDKDRGKKKKENRDARACNEINHFFFEREEKSIPSFSFITSDRCSFTDWPRSSSGSSFEQNRVEFARSHVCSTTDIPAVSTALRIIDAQYNLFTRHDFSLFCFSFFFFANYIRYIFGGRKSGALFFLHRSISVSLHVNSARISAIFQLGREQL